MRQWVKSATVRGALVGGMSVLLAALLSAGVTISLNRRPAPVVSLELFTLNSDECFFEPIAQVESMNIAVPAWAATVKAQAVRLAMEVMMDEKAQAVVEEVFGEEPLVGASDLNNPDLEWYLSSVPDEVWQHQAREIFIVVREGGEQAQMLVEKLSPVFDLTVLNEGDGTALLSHIQVEIMDVSREFEGEGGGRDAEIAIPAPVESAYRYVVPLRRFYARQYSETEWPQMPLLPPLEIPAQRPIRFQVRLHEERGEYLYRLRLRLIFNGGRTIATPIFAVQFYPA